MTRLTLNQTERATAKAFERLLHEHGLPASWERGSDPPDLVYDVAGERWGVEETQLHDYIGESSFAEYEHSLRHVLERDIRDELQRMGRAPSPVGYLIFAAAPVAQLELRLIKRGVRDYVRDGKTGVEHLGRDGRVSIRTIPHPGEVRCRVYMHVDSSKDIVISVEEGLSRALEAKMPDLAKITEYDRRILVLTKVFVHATPEVMKPLLEGILDKHPVWSGQLDAVLLIHTDADHYFPGDGREIIHLPGDICLVAAPGEWAFPYPQGFTAH